ncbi:MAG: HDIG domain-containing protein, partial [Crenarchaeota archaeon]|nr:HDIG domain-containing protein [Thermoproteota archaeon]
MTFEEALDLVRRHVKNDKLIKHMLAVAAIMEKLAERLGEDRELWKLVGLLHDIDYELTQSQPEKHGLAAAEILRGKLPEHAIRAIQAHNELTGVKDDSKLAIALRAADAVSGLIVAAALVMPNKRLSEVKLDTLLRKFKQKDFARGVKREKILECEKLGMSLEDFLSLSLE